MNKFLTKIIGASLAIAMMIGVGAGMNANKAAKEVNAMTNSYTVGTTALTSVSDGDLVAWGTSSTSLASSVGSNWIYTSNTKSEWLVFEVEEGTDGFYLKDTASGNYIYSSATKKVSMDSTSQKTLLTLVSVTGKGYLVSGGSSIGKYTYNTTGIRPYSSNTYNAANLYPVSAALTVTGISLNENELVIGIGNQATLTPTFTPDGASADVTWSSNNESVATVNAGVVTAVAAGEATITARVSETIYAQCLVTVPAGGIPAESISLSETSGTLVKGQIKNLTAEVLPANTTDSVVWSSNNESVATVEDGVITAVAAGQATITATAGDVHADFALTVNPLNAANNYLNAQVNITGKVVAINGRSAMIDDGTSGLWAYADSNISASVGDVVNVTGQTTAYNGGLEVNHAVVTAAQGEITTLTAEAISQDDVANIISHRSEANYYVAHRKVSLRTGTTSVSGNYITWSYGESSMETNISTGGMQGGKVYDIEGYLVNFYNAFLCICVTSAVEPVIEPEAVTLNQTEVVLGIGGTFTLTSTVTPQGASQEVTWSSDNESVATVEDGVITAVAAGEATITARVNELISATCSVVVTRPIHDTSATLFSVDLTPTQPTYTAGFTFTSTSATHQSGGYFQDGSGTNSFTMKSASPLFDVEPTKIVFTASLGCGATKDPLDNPVQIAFIDSNGDVIGDPIDFKTAFDTKAATTYTAEMEYSASAYGVKLMHVKESGWNCRYYSFSLSYSYAESVKTIVATESNEGATVDNVLLRFGGKMSTSVWESLGTVTEFGVIFSTSTALASNSANSIKVAVRDNKTAALYTIRKTAAAPTTTSGTDYLFTARLSIEEEDYDTVFHAAPYIIANGEYYFFPEMIYSVRTLAAECLETHDSPLSTTALGVLANAGN